MRIPFVVSDPAAGNGSVPPSEFQVTFEIRSTRTGELAPECAGFCDGTLADRVAREMGREWRAFRREEPVCHDSDSEKSLALLEMAMNSSYNRDVMDFSIADAKNRLPELIRAVEGGERIVITRHGKAVAQLVPAPAERRTARLGGMKDRIQLLPGWDAPVDLDAFLAGEL